MSSKRIKEDRIILGKEEQFKFETAEEIKVKQLYPQKIDEFKSFANLRNTKGVEFVLFPDGGKGVKLTYKDDTSKLYYIDSEGKFIEVIPYKDYVITNTFMDKVSRLFGLTKEMQFTKSRKIDLIHGLMFLTGCVLIVGLIFLMFAIWNYSAL